MSEKMKYRFSGHQTFVFRHGWLEKGVGLIRETPRGFLDTDVLIKLGVGKNMVESIKYWCFQTQLLKETESSGALELTRMAKLIFGERDEAEGVDPYLEDDATLWLLHWLLIQNPVISTWQLVFARLHKPEFTKTSLLQSIQTWLLGQTTVSESTLARDVDCFVRSYAGTRGKYSEENFDSPLLSLGLIQPTSESDLYRFNIGAKRNLPTEIVGYALLMNMAESNRTTMLVQSCLYDAGHPGQVFKLDEGALMDYLADLESKTKHDLSVTDTAGMVSVSFVPKKQVPPAEYADALLARYYGKAVSK